MTAWVIRGLAKSCAERRWIAITSNSGDTKAVRPGLVLPIPNSEKHGRREYYSLDQCRRGGVKSGRTRRSKAIAKWNEVVGLRKRGFGIRQIARVVGFTAGWVSKLVKRLCPSVAQVFPEHSHHPGEPPIRGSRTLTLLALYEAEAHRRLRETTDVRQKRLIEKQLSEKCVSNRRRSGKIWYVGLESRILHCVRKIERESPGREAVMAVKAATEAVRALSGLPIEQQVMAVNAWHRKAA